MAVKHLKQRDDGQIVLAIPDIRKASKPKAYIEDPRITAYKMERDKHLIEKYPYIKDEINLLEYGLLGVKSAKTAKIVTEEQDKKNRASRYAEMTLQATFCKWVSKEYPNVKFIHHEREGKRGGFKQNQNKVLNTAGSMPDWETTQTTDRYAGLLIEFKRPGEDWLLKSGHVKPKYVHQYECHLQLWEQRKVVYFCNDLEIAKMILKQYLEGRTMRQRTYKIKE